MTYTPSVSDTQSPTLDRELARIDWLARTLDSRFRIPGTGIRFGYDTILGLVPGIGDTVTTAPTAWMVWVGYTHGLRKRHLLRMMGNTLVDYVIGSIPLIGDLFDIGFKANLKNAALLRRELTRQAGSRSA